MRKLLKTLYILIAGVTLIAMALPMNVMASGSQSGYCTVYEVNVSGTPGKELHAVIKALDAEYEFDPEKVAYVYEEDPGETSIEVEDGTWIFGGWTPEGKQALYDGLTFTATWYFEPADPTPTPDPTEEPSPEPTYDPTPEPTEEPTPTETPTAKPTQTPSPTATPTSKPTPKPTVKPIEPTALPTIEPLPDLPEEEPEPEPEEEPTPTVRPTAAPTARSTAAPTARPTVKPTASPSKTPVPKKVTPGASSKKKDENGNGIIAGSTSGPDKNDTPKPPKNENAVSPDKDGTEKTDGSKEDTAALPGTSSAGDTASAAGDGSQGASSDPGSTAAEGSVEASAELMAPVAAGIAGTAAVNVLLLGFIISDLKVLKWYKSMKKSK